MTWLEIARGLVVTDAKYIARDRFVSFVFGYVLFLAFAVRFGVPPLTGVLIERYGVDIQPYYGLIASTVALSIGAGTVGILLGFLLLEARETRIVDAVSVSPLTFDRFLAYRIGVPMVVAMAINPLCAWICGFGQPPVLPMLVISLIAMLFGGLGTLALASFADNKVQAFAVMKIISGLSMLPLAGYFVPEPYQFGFGLFPPYWLFKAWWVAEAGGSLWWLYAAVGAVTNVGFLWWMKRRFERAVHRGAAS